MKTIRFIFSGIALITALAFSGQLSAQDKITLTWQAEGEKFVDICTTEGTFTINWGDGTIKTIEGSCMRLFHSYTVAGKYTVTITTTDNNCRITSFKCVYGFGPTQADNQISSLILTNCSALTTLHCYYNQITNLDLSDCSALKDLACYNNPLTSLDLSHCPNLNWLECGGSPLTTSGSSSLTNLNLTGCTALYHIACNNSQITHLDLTGCPNLYALYCSGNQLTSIDYGNINELKTIFCYDNKLQLSDLYKAHSLVELQTSKLLGTQTPLSQTVDVDVELFADQSVFDGIFTEYTVTKNENPAPKSDYSINDGKITFNNVGIYTVTMTNKAIASLNDAEIIIELNVGGVSGISDISLFNISVYPNPAKDIISIQSSSTIEQVSIYDISGKLLNQQNNVQESISISDLANGIYLVKIKTEEGETVRKIIKN